VLFTPNRCYIPPWGDLTVSKRTGTSNRIEIQFHTFNHLSRRDSFVKLSETLCLCLAKGKECLEQIWNSDLIPLMRYWVILNQKWISFLQLVPGLFRFPRSPGGVSIDIMGANLVFPVIGFPLPQKWCWHLHYKSASTVLQWLKHFGCCSNTQKVIRVRVKIVTEALMQSMFHLEIINACLNYTLILTLILILTQTL
jgi:hypothetical protein